jgi:predicted ester cyclase
MHDPALSFEPGALSPRKEVVRVFYKEMWDNADKSLIPRIFHEGFTFRGSLGPVLVGHREFAGYVDLVTGALGDYTSDILALVEDGDTVAGRLRFHGIHRRALFDIQPSGRHVWWYGAPFFTFDGDKVRDLWVLGDIHGLIARLRGSDESMPDAKPDA